MSFAIKEPEQMNSGVPCASSEYQIEATQGALDAASATSLPKTTASERPAKAASATMAAAAINATAPAVRFTAFTALTCVILLHRPLKGTFLRFPR
ncbi:unannotated protein [freshwater metagenome]|uniref:Unannotated protein n=1 Tax=freshwater metagenome TaxID=449393 RepID=A0A6J7VA78_9ZZZZ